MEGFDSEVSVPSINVVCYDEEWDRLTEKNVVGVGARVIASRGRTTKKRGHQIDG